MAETKKTEPRTVQNATYEEKITLLRMCEVEDAGGVVHRIPVTIVVKVGEILHAWAPKAHRRVTHRVTGLHRRVVVTQVRLLADERPEGG